MSQAAVTSDTGVDVGVKLLDERSTAGYRLILELHRDELECRASIEVHDPDQAPLASDLLTYLRTQLFEEAINEEKVALFCAAAAEGKSQTRVLLAVGKEPTRGETGWFDFAVRTSDAEAEFVADEHGTVDLRTRHTFSNIEPDMLIGRVMPPQAGERGYTVTGLPIPALLGEALELTAGEGVEFRDQGATAYATKSGRAVFEDEVLSISDEYVINGDLDLSVGNIDFQGFVEIRGDVLDDFSIRSTKGIKVTGAVGASRLESNGPVQIGSMAGTEIGLIRCGGDLTAHHLNGVTVEVHGNVVISNEIRNSLVKATGRVSVARGTIAGGTTIALEGIEARQIGAISGLATRLVAGVYFPEEDRIDALRKNLHSVEGQIDRIRATLGPLRPRSSGSHALQDAIAVRVRVLGNRLSKLEKDQQRLSGEISSFKRDDHPTANPKINVSQLLLEGTKIKLGNSFVDIQYERQAGTSIIEDSTSGGLRFLSLTPLKIQAAELEQEILNQETDEAEQIDDEDQA